MISKIRISWTPPTDSMPMHSLTAPPMSEILRRDFDLVRSGVFVLSQAKQINGQVLKNSRSEIPIP